MFLVKINFQVTFHKILVEVTACFINFKQNSTSKILGNFHKLLALYMSLTTQNIIVHSYIKKLPSPRSSQVHIIQLTLERRYLIMI